MGSEAHCQGYHIREGDRHLVVVEDLDVVALDLFRTDGLILDKP